MLKKGKTDTRGRKDREKMYPDARDHIWGPDSAISLACDLELGDYVHICDLGGNTITREFQSGSDAVAQSPGDSGILCAKVTQSIPILHPHMLADRKSVV